MTGTVHYVSSFPEFSAGNPDLQKGNYFPLKFGRTGTQFTAKYNSDAENAAKDMPDDGLLVLRLRTKTDKIELKVDGTHLVTLDFSTATVEDEG